MVLGVSGEGLGWRIGVYRVEDRGIWKGG